MRFFPFSLLIVIYRGFYMVARSYESRRKNNISRVSAANE